MNKRDNFLAIGLLLCFSAGFSVFVGCSTLGRNSGTYIPARIGDTSVETPSTILEGVIYSGVLTYKDETFGIDYSGRYYAYVPNTAGYGDRATSNPAFVLYGSYANENAAKTAIQAAGLDAIADVEHAPVIIVGPQDTTWSAADAASLVAVVKTLFSDTSNQKYDNKGKSADTKDNNGNTVPGKFPGTITRLIVFADGAAADFVYEHVAVGISGPGQFFGESVWKPAAMYLSNLSNTTSVPLSAKSNRGLPVYLVNATSQAGTAFETLNSSTFPMITAVSANKDGFDMSAVLTGYDKVLEHWVTRDMAQGVTLLPISDTTARGLTVSRDQFEDVRYYQYTPASIKTAAKGTVPLVIVFHGMGNTAEYQVWMSGWDILATEKGFVVVSVQDHMDVSNAKVIALIDSLLGKYSFLDETRVYASGFSMGGGKSWSLGMEYPNRFAGIIPCNLMSDGIVMQGITPKKLLIPVYYMGGADSHMNNMEFPNPDDSPKLIEYFFEINGITADFAFDPDYTFTGSFFAGDTPRATDWGLAPGSVYSLTASDLPNLKTTVSVYTSTNGNVYTEFAHNTYAGHEPLRGCIADAWNFISRFSRETDGSIAVDKNGTGGL
jgi:hypothetical protein